MAERLDRYNKDDPVFCEQDVASREEAVSVLESVFTLEQPLIQSKLSLLVSAVNRADSLAKRAKQIGASEGENERYSFDFSWFGHGVREFNVSEWQQLGGKQGIQELRTELDNVLRTVADAMEVLDVSGGHEHCRLREFGSDICSFVPWNYNPAQTPYPFLNPVFEKLASDLAILGGVFASPTTAQCIDDAYVKKEEVPWAIRKLNGRKKSPFVIVTGK